VTTNNWYVITGAPSAGKSTIITELAKRGYVTVEEYGRKLIDQGLASGKTLAQINVDSPEFELAWIELQHRGEATTNTATATFFDRGIIDTLAYFAYYNWPIPDRVTELCKHSTYKKVFLLEILDYKQDYARIESAETAHAMQQLFGKVYRDAGYEVIFIKRDTVENRLEEIIKSL
jgi:predicted ATPase